MTTKLKINNNNFGRNSPLRARTCQLTACLKFTCPQTGMNDHAASLGVTTGRVPILDPTPSFPYFLLPSWRAVRSYRPHLEERDPIWSDNWSHSPFIRRSPSCPSWGFLGFSSAVRQMPGDLCTAPRIISLSPLSLATDVTDATLGASGLWPH